MIKIAKIQFNPFGENTYVLSAESGECIVVDAGMYNDAENETLVAYIEKNNLTPVMAIATHGHVDHICGVEFVVKKWGVPFAISSNDQFLLDGAAEHGAMMGFEVGDVPAVDIDLSKTQELTLGGETITVIQTPGHSPGCVSLYVATQKMLLTGDTLFHGSIGRTDLPGGDYNVLMTSVMKNILPLGGDVAIFPGHGSDSTLASEAQHNPFITDVLNGDTKY